MSSPATSQPIGSPLSPRATYLRSSSSPFTSPGASSSSGGSTPSRPPSAIFVGNSSAAYTAAMAGEVEKPQEKTVSRATRGAERSSSFRAAVGAGGLPSPPATNSDATSSAGKAAGKAALELGSSSKQSNRRQTTSSLNRESEEHAKPDRQPSLSSRHRVTSARRLGRKNSASSDPTSPPKDTPVDPSPERAAAHKSALMTLTNTHTPSRLNDSMQRQGSSGSESTPRRPTPSAGNGRSPGTESLRKLLSRPAASPGSPLNSLGRSSSRHQHTASSPSALSPAEQGRPSSSSADRRQLRGSFDARTSPSPTAYETHSKRRVVPHTTSDEMSPIKDTIRRSNTLSHEISPRHASPYRQTESEEMTQAKERVGSWMNGQGDEGGEDARFNSGGSGSQRKPLPQDFRSGSLFTPSPKSNDVRSERGTRSYTPSRHTPSDYNSPRRSATIALRGQDHSSPSSPYTPSGLSRVRDQKRQSAVAQPENANDGAGYARRTWHDTISGLPRPRDRPESVLAGNAAYRYQARGGSAESGLTTQRLSDRERLRPASTVGMTPSPNRSRLSHMDSVSQRHGQSEAGGSSDPLEVLARLEQAREESQRKRALLLQDRPQSVLDSPRTRDRFDDQRYRPRPSSRTTWTPVEDRQPLRSASSMSFIRDREPRTAPAGHRIRHIDGMPDSPSVGRGASRASNYHPTAAAARSEVQGPRAMRSNSSLGSRAGQLPATSATEHGRLLLDACRSIESRFGQGTPGLSDLIRSSHSAARASEVLNALLREALAMATQAQIQIEVEGTDARDVIAKLTANLRDGSKASDENVRSLTGILLCLPKVLRDAPLGVPRRSGSFETDSVNGHGSSGRSSARHVRTPADFTRHSMDVETRSATSVGDRSTYSRRSVDQESPRRSGSLLSYTSRKLFPGSSKSPTQISNPRLPLPSIPSSNDVDTLSSHSQASPTKSSSSLLRKRPSAMTVKSSNSSFFPAIRGSAPTTAVSQVTVGEAASSPSQAVFPTSPRPRLASVGSDQDDTVSMLERKLADSSARQTREASTGQRNSVDSKSSSGRAARFWRRASKGTE